MKKLFTILFLFITLAAQAQYGPRTDIQTVQSIVNLKTYNGTAYYVLVDDSLALYKPCSPCVADEVYVFAGTRGRNWIKAFSSGIIPDSRLSGNVAKLDAVTWDFKGQLNVYPDAGNTAGASFYSTGDARTQISIGTDNSYWDFTLWNEEYTGGGEGTGIWDAYTTNGNFINFTAENNNPVEFTANGNAALFFKPDGLLRFPQYTTPGFIKINNSNGDVVVDNSSYALSSALADKVDKISGKGLSAEDYTTPEKTKLSGVATGATANSSDATLLSRSNHTGTQAISTVATLADSLATYRDSIAQLRLSLNNYINSQEFQSVITSTYTNSAANSPSNVTGLSFPVVSGGTYWFEFNFRFNVNDPTMGTRWAVNGPTFSMLRYTANWSNGASAFTAPQAILTYDGTGVTGNSAATEGNQASVFGYITVTANGTVTLRGAVENTGTVTIDPYNGWVKWKKLN